MQCFYRMLTSISIEETADTEKEITLQLLSPIRQTILFKTAARSAENHHRIATGPYLHSKQRLFALQVRPDSTSSNARLQCNQAPFPIEVAADWLTVSYRKQKTGNLLVPHLFFPFCGKHKRSRPDDVGESKLSRQKQKNIHLIYIIGIQAETNRRGKQDRQGSGLRAKELMSCKVGRSGKPVPVSLSVLPQSYQYSAEQED